ncbi:MAG: hypothetical protein KJO43_11875 [Phycisphaerae bacterium]|nr:hypothetical protein [Phycisphaerae bacterium]NNF43020.1 hypothetical protein [Phycisphaerales bacterium]
MPHAPAPRTIIFDDGRGQLGPMTDLRAAFEVRTGMFTTAERIQAARPKMLAGYWVPTPLRAVVAERANAPVNELPASEEVVLCLNGRWAMPDGTLQLEANHAIQEEATGHIVAACLRRADAAYFLETGQLHERARIKTLHKRVLYKYPWDVLAFMKETVPHDILSERLVDARVASPDMTVVGRHPVELHRTASVGPHVVFDASQGPIFVHEDAQLRPGCVICGPASIGRGSTVVDRALIKAYTVIGPVCKVGGEVGGTIFQGYANKGHEGHLGDSWVGEWVNLGAGTTNSNLLNTYGEVSMRTESDGPRHRTGLVFVGAVIGDHVKTAIGTRIMTGTVLGTGSMIASTAPPPASVRRFAWRTDEGERLYRVEKFRDAMRTMMSRRDRTPTPAQIELMESLHASSSGATSPPHPRGAEGLPTSVRAD